LSLLHAVVLALVQAVTEFLPISSSAHLILVPRLLGWPDQGLAFDIATNTGTMLAVIAYFRRDLLELAAGLLGRRQGEVEGMPPRRFFWALVVGTAPAAVAALLIHHWVETVARDPRILATTLIVFGLVLLAADRLGARRRELAGLGIGDALLIGLAQALALVPGTSRSGATIAAALALGFRRPAAARFSFLLAIPVGILAAGYDGLKILSGKVALSELAPMVVAVVVSAVAGYLVIGWLLGWLQRQTLSLFVVYRLALGVTIAVVLL
jgi:undecaprenyl-diphosphatase